MKRSQRLRIIPAALLAASLAVPGMVSHAAPVAAHANASPVTIRFANFLGPAFVKQAQKVILPAYYKAYPGTQVEFEPTIDRVKAVTEIAAGTAADVFNLGDGDVGWYEDKGALVDLAPYMKAAHFSLNQYIPGSLVFGKVGSHQYSLPKDYSSLAIYYNKDMFKKAGLALPTDNWTWDEFRQDAIKLTSNGVYGASLPGNWVRAIDPVIRSLGGQLDSPDGKHVLGYMNSPATIKAVQFWVDLFVKDKVAPTPTEAAAINGDLFASQKAAMSLTGVWPTLGTSGYRQTLKFNWGVVQLPRGTTAANAICYAGFAMSKTTQHAKQAYGLIQYMSGPVGDALWATNALPSIKTVADKIGATKDPIDSVFLKAADFTTLPSDANGPAAAQGVGDTLSEGLNLLLGSPGTSVAQVLQIEAKKGQAKIDSYYK